MFDNPLRTIRSDFLCAVQRADKSRDRFSKGEVVNAVRKVITCNTTTNQNKITIKESIPQSKLYCSTATTVGKDSKSQKDNKLTVMTD